MSKSLPEQKLTGLIIDGSGWEKKGEKSAGVAPQYCGNAGKVSNSQVAVFGALSNGDFASMVDVRLYLSASWISDTRRCEEAGIPEEERVFKKKWEIAIEETGYVYMLDIHSSLTVYLEASAIEVPSPRGKRGRQPKQAKPAINGIRYRPASDRSSQYHQREIERRLSLSNGVCF